jgi:ACS family hexuronate transporter-like MFS transporter
VRKTAVTSLSFRIKSTLVTTLLLATILNYLDRQTISILAPTLQHQMGLSNAHLGWLFAIFYYSYTLFQFAVGPVLDRFNLRWCFVLAVMAWSLVLGLTGLATGFASFMVFRAGSPARSGHSSGRLARRFAGIGAYPSARGAHLNCGVFDSGRCDGKPLLLFHRELVAHLCG